MSKKMSQKGLKLAFLAKNSHFLADFFLNGIGGYPPPLNGQSPKKSKKMGQKGLKLAFLAKNSRFLADFFLNGQGGVPPHPLTDNRCAQKSLADRGGTPPLSGKIR